MASTNTAQDLSGACILILYDDASMRSLIRGALARSGCKNILQSATGRGALQLFGDRTIDLVICDWMMEPMSGLEFLRELRRPERALSVPVIVLSMSSGPKDISRAEEFKINGWLAKPIVLQQSLDKIGVTIGQSSTNVSPDGSKSIAALSLSAQYRARVVDELQD